MARKESGINNVTAQIIEAIQMQNQSGSGKEVLSDLRHSIGKPLSQSPGIWTFLFKYLPEKYLSETGKETNGERAICSTLQLYALMQQGSNKIEYTNQENIGNIGKSFGKIRNQDSLALDRRFNMVLTSREFNEMFYRLRQLIKLAKSIGDLQVDYSRLSEDFYLWLLGYDDRVKLSWAQSYYQTQKPAEDKQLKEENER